MSRQGLHVFGAASPTLGPESLSQMSLFPLPGDAGDAAPEVISFPPCAFFGVTEFRFQSRIFPELEELDGLGAPPGPAENSLAFPGDEPLPLCQDSRCPEPAGVIEPRPPDDAELWVLGGCGELGAPVPAKRLSSTPD
jgi:hypothetical protein